MDQHPAVYAKQALYWALEPSDAYLRWWVAENKLELTDDEYAAIYAQYESIGRSMQAQVDTNWVARMERVAIELEGMR